MGFYVQSILKKINFLKLPYGIPRGLFVQITSWDPMRDFVMKGCFFFFSFDYRFLRV